MTYSTSMISLKLMPGPLLPGFLRPALEARCRGLAVGMNFSQTESRVSVLLLLSDAIEAIACSKMG